jgi:uncharacterized membrane protein YqjE
VAVRARGHTTGMSSFPPASSALNLRTALAAFGLVLCVVLAAITWANRSALPGGAVLAVLFALGAVAAVVDLVVLARRRADRRAADARAGHTESRSLFE